ncbi:MAG: element excision factor XisH family protein [Saprospiraceae bacterium]
MARDKYHYIVREALEKDGWVITHDPYRFRYLTSKDQEIDLGAERGIIGAERGVDKIAVEIKSFLADSPLQDLYKAVGQYLLYLDGLEQLEPNRSLYLAMPDVVLESEFNQELLLKFLFKHNIKLIVFNIEAAKIEKWLP